MRFLHQDLVVTAVSCLALIGCSGNGGGNVTFAPVTGNVTFNGSPLAGAQVRFYPDKGPMAAAETDANGNFKLKSGGFTGCAVGNAKAAVLIFEDAAPAAGGQFGPPPTDPVKLEEYHRKMAEGTMAAQEEKEPSKPTIPLKYKDPAQSGLSYKVESGGLKDVKIQLKD